MMPGGETLYEVDADEVGPFLKWAGGKRWFASKYRNLAPKRYGTYFEPFLGSGAMFFAQSPAKAVLADLNSDLIACYLAIRDYPNEIARALTEHQAQHCKEYYYAVRARKPSEAVDLAAWFIYLNRTCWNGLYRVNRNNIFNVPIGTKQTVVLAADDFVGVSRRLAKATLRVADFEDVISTAAGGDFVFCDPPYTVRHNENGFVKYNDKLFSWNDQVRLRNCLLRASQRGVKVILTNANHSSVRDLYVGIGRCFVTERHSILAASPANRDVTEELVIVI